MGTGARRVWNALYHRWSQAPATVQINHLVDYATGLATPPVATATRLQMYKLTHDDATILRSTRRAWRVACGAVGQSIWLQRNAAVFSDHFPNVFEHEGKALRAARDQILALGAHLRATTKTHVEGQLLEALAASLREPSSPAATSMIEVRMYFDGGSRGNPGRTGTGSVIIERRDGDWTVMWWSAHYLGDTSTNNEAEHEALRRGVTGCGRRYSQRCANIIIIGDSQIILRQVDGTNQTTNTNLAHAVRRAQRALRQLDSYEFRHTLRTDNKMAEFLANVAMDQGHTSNGPDGPDLTTQTLYDLLDADIQHDTTPPHPTYDLLSTLRAHLNEQRSTASPLDRKRGSHTPPAAASPKRPRPLCRDT